MPGAVLVVVCVSLQVSVRLHNNPGSPVGDPWVWNLIRQQSTAQSVTILWGRILQLTLSCIQVIILFTSPFTEHHQDRHVILQWAISDVYNQCTWIYLKCKACWLSDCCCKAKPKWKSVQQYNSGRDLYAPAGLLMFVCACAFQARSAEIPELRTEPLMRSCSSSTASMKVKNVKKWVDTHTHLPLPVSSTSLTSLLPSVHLYLSLLTACLSPLFPAWVPSIPRVYFCVFLLLSLPLCALRLSFIY